MASACVVFFLVEGIECRLDFSSLCYHNEVQFVHPLQDDFSNKHLRAIV